MLLTLGKAREEVAEAVVGECSGSDKVRDRINAAQRQLLLRADWAGTLQTYRFHTCDGCITLPHEIEAIRHVEVMGCTGDVRNQWFEYIENGPGKLDVSPGIYTGLLDRGDFHVTRTEIEVPTRILVYGTDAEDDEKAVFISGRDASGLPVVDHPDDPLKPGTQVILRKNNPQYTRATFSKLTSIIKPRTRGTVYVYAYYPETMGHVLLTTLFPEETAPTYRRYRVAGAACDTPTTIDVLAKRRHIDAYHDEAVLTIQNVDAIKEMVKALEAANNNDTDRAAQYEARAIRLLKLQLRNQGSPEVQIEVQGYAFGYGARIGGRV